MQVDDRRRRAETLVKKQQEEIIELEIKLANAQSEHQKSLVSPRLHYLNRGSVVECSNARVWSPHGAQGLPYHVESTIFIRSLQYTAVGRCY